MAIRGESVRERITDPERLRAVRATEMMDTVASEVFDDLAKLASTLTGMPLAFVTFVDDQRSYWKATIGTGIAADDTASRANAVEESFCQYVIATDGPVIVTDAATDPLTHQNPSIESMGLRSWAGYPIRDGAGHVLGSFCVVDTLPREFTPLDLTVLSTLAEAAQREVRLIQALAQARQLAADTQADTERSGRLAAASDRLSDSLDAAQVLSALGDIVVPELGSWVAVGLLGGVVRGDVTGRFEVSADGPPEVPRVVLIRHRDRAKQAALSEALLMVPVSMHDSRGLGRVIATGVAEYSTAASETPHLEQAPDALSGVWPLIAGDAVLTVPLVSRGQIVGAFTIGAPGAADADRSLLQQLAQRAATALDNALSYAAAQRAVIDLQQTLMPTQPPSLPGVEVTARYLPSTSGALVGGDFHQVIRREDDLILVLGDIEGHGMPSAARMGQLRAAVAALALEGHDPSNLLARLSAGTDQILDISLATVLVARLRPDDRELTIASAGHPPPVICEPGRVAFVAETDPGPPLGLGRAVYAQHSLRLEPGAVLVAYSDGLIERRNEHLDIGLARLCDAVTHAATKPDLSQFNDHILDAMGCAQGGPDDIALLTVRT